MLKNKEKLPKLRSHCCFNIFEEIEDRIEWKVLERGFWRNSISQNSCKMRFAPIHTL